MRERAKRIREEAVRGRDRDREAGVRSSLEALRPGDVVFLPSARRQGLGLKTYQMLLTYLFDHYNIHMVYLRVADFNDGAVELYRRAGFHETGRLVSSIYRHGRRWDTMIMCLTRDEFQAHRPAGTP